MIYNNEPSCDGLHDLSILNGLEKISQYYQYPRQQYYRQKEPYRYKAWHTIPAGIGVGAAYGAGTAIAYAPAMRRYGNKAASFLEKRAPQAIRQAASMPVNEIPDFLSKTIKESGKGGAALGKIGDKIQTGFKKHLGRAKKLGIGVAAAGPALWAAGKVFGGSQR